MGGGLLQEAFKVVKKGSGNEMGVILVVLSIL